MHIIRHNRSIRKCGQIWENLATQFTRVALTKNRLPFVAVDKCLTINELKVFAATLITVLFFPS